MAKFVPKILEPILNYVPSEFVSELTSYASKAMRIKIIAYDREHRGFEKAEVKGPRDAYEHEDTTGIYASTKKHRETVNPDYVDGRGTQIDTTGYKDEPVGRQARVSGEVLDYISIVDLDFGNGKFKDKHKTDRYYSYIQLPFVPRELDYKPESNFVGIASMGRNNPFYQFTGSEDTLTFEIDWFSKQLNREDVIFNCRWLESLTKGDAYDEPPHRVKIVWGEDNKLFDDSEWLLVDAPYKLSQFVKAYADADRNVISVGMLPQQAYQTVTFKRLTKLNRSSKEIIGNLGNR